VTSDTGLRLRDGDRQTRIRAEPVGSKLVGKHTTRFPLHLDPAVSQHEQV